MRLVKSFAIVALNLLTYYRYAMSGSISTAANVLFKSKFTMSLDLAKLIATASAEEARLNGWSVVCSILDDGGNLVYLERMDGTQIGSIQVSQDKAKTAISFKRSTKVFEDMILSSGKQNYLKMANCLPIEGGMPLLYKNELIGSIGISGVTSAQDGQIALAGVAKLASLATGL